MELKPLHDRVLVQRSESEAMTKGGIIIPDNAREKPIEGKVVASGEGLYKEDGTIRPMSVKVGDKVLFSKYAGTEVKVEDVELLLMREEDILAVII